MTAYSIWPSALCTLSYLALASTPLLRWADSTPSNTPHRNETLDGLRGFLALGVFFHHAAITHLYVTTGRWDSESHVYELFGRAGVAAFFMITGHLFWGKIIKDSGKPNWAALYLGRLFRIVPLYWVAVAAMLLVVFSRSGFHLREPASAVAGELVQWSAFGLFPPGPVNNYLEAPQILAGVTWTLQYEWWFYLSLAFTSIAARFPKARDFVLSAGLCAALIAMAVSKNSDPKSIQCVSATFLIGMLSAVAGNSRLLQWNKTLKSAFVAGGLAIIVYGFPTLSQAVPLLVLGLVFLLIVSGSDFFGLLRTRAARRLGDISYGIYLLQGLILTAVFYGHRYAAALEASPLRHWAAVWLSGLLLILTAMAAHVLIERPAIDLGKRLVKHWNRKPAPDRLSRTEPTSSRI